MAEQSDTLTLRTFERLTEGQLVLIRKTSNDQKNPDVVEEEYRFDRIDHVSNYGGLRDKALFSVPQPARDLRVDGAGPHDFTAHRHGDHYTTDYGHDTVEAIVPDDGTYDGPVPPEKFTITYSTTIEITVEVEAADEDNAVESAAAAAQTYLNSLRGDGRVVAASASIDGMPADSIREGFRYTE